MRQGSFLIAGGGRGTRTTPLREDHEVKPLRRSELARRDWRPEPVTTGVEPKKSWRHRLLTWTSRTARTVGHAARWIIPLVSLALFIYVMLAGSRWVKQHSSGGTMVQPETIYEVQERAYFRLPALAPPWHWAMLPYALATDAQGRPSFFIRARDRGTVKSERDLPLNAEIGDQYTLANGTTSWVFMTPYGAKQPSWIDP